MSEYGILEKTDRQALMAEVEKALAKGYTPIGGVSISYNGTTLVYVQAVARVS